MALHRVNSLPEQPQVGRRAETSGVGICPVCELRMEVVYQRSNQTVSVCANCDTGVTAFGAWTIARVKGNAQ